MTYRTNEPGHFTLSQERARLHGKRAGRATAQRYAVVVEGKLYSVPQIAERIGMSQTTARHRIKNTPKPLTWAGLSTVTSWSTHEHDPASLSPVGPDGCP